MNGKKKYFGPVELVAQRNGKMYLIKPGDIGGASFGFDLPLARRRK
jgi:hypothetical protein